MTTTRPLLIFRIGYMTSYDGIGEIHGGGAYIEEHGEGGEMWNFRAEGGRCYGYVMTRQFSGIDLSRISDAHKWAQGDELEGVDIVFVARKLNVGQVVVGWYNNAAIIHRQYRPRRGKKAKGDWDQIEYLSEVEAQNAHLLPESERVFIVPRGEGFPGQANVWYGTDSNARVGRFLSQLRRYMSQSSGVAPVQKRRHQWTMRSTPDKDYMLQVEKTAIARAWKFFENAGFAVESVEKDNRGWDLEASKKGVVLRLEVKGHAGNVVQFELTPNEYAQMQNHNNSFRVCVVRNALTNPDLKVFVPKHLDGKWLLCEEGGAERIKLLEKVAAKAAQVSVN